MTSLIAQTIATMGDPNSAPVGPRSSVSSGASSDSARSKSTRASSISSATSITVLNSFRDWWSSSSDLMSATEPRSQKSAKTRAAEHKNRRIEYDLFRAILSDDIYLKPVEEVQNGNETTATPIEGSEASKNPETPPQLTGELLDIVLDDSFTIHEFYLQNDPNVPREEEIHIVIIHGYMAALGYFIKNVEPLLKSRRGIRLHLIDMPGFGNSSRPQFPTEFLDDPETTPERIQQILKIENWFIDNLEAWRIKRGITKFKLIGHSMGAYLSSCYLMKYNKLEAKLVEEFIVVSPMGTESSSYSLLNHKKFQFNHHEVGGDPFKELHFHDESENQYISEEVVNLWKKLGQPRFPKNYILEKIWKYHKSPFQILQKLGPFYSKILSYWSFQRFKNLSANEEDETETETEAVVMEDHSITSTDLILKLHNYSYSIFNQYQGSGELAITKLISHEILARLPLCDRGFIDYLHKAGVRTSWIYGDKDWMNRKGGEYIYQQLRDLDDTSTEFSVLENAGHHIYLDNPARFNETCLRFFNLD